MYGGIFPPFVFFSTSPDSVRSRKDSRYGNNGTTRTPKSHVVAISNSPIHKSVACSYNW